MSTPRPLDPVERALLAQVGAAPDDESARRVLADHWLDGADEPRGALVQQQCEGHDGAALIAEHGARWRHTTVAAGFPPDQLALRRGFAASALVLDAGEPLLACPDALRLSPRQYVVVRELAPSAWRRHYEVVARTPAGELGRFALTCAQPAMQVVRPIARDATLLARLGHPNANRLVELALHREAGRGLVLAWAGEPLAARTLPGAPDEALALAIGLPLCDALIALAAQGIVHHRVEPRSVLLRDDGHVTLAGFGDATAPDLAPLPRSMHGRMAYRFRHMSREQVLGARVTPATDVFSLAVLIATLALGRHPLPRRESDFETIVAIRDHAYELPGVTPLLRLLRAAIVPDAAARPTAAELAAGLAALGPRDPERIARLASSR